MNNILKFVNLDYVIKRDLNIGYKHHQVERLEYDEDFSKEENVPQYLYNILYKMFKDAFNQDYSLNIANRKEGVDEIIEKYSDVDDTLIIHNYSPYMNIMGFEYTSKEDYQYETYNDRHVIIVKTDDTRWNDIKIINKPTMRIDASSLLYEVVEGKTKDIKILYQNYVLENVVSKKSFTLK